MGGHPAYERDWPFVVNLEVSKEYVLTGSGKTMAEETCGGAAISQDVIATSGKCVFNVDEEASSGVKKSEKHSAK